MSLRTPTHRLVATVIGAGTMGAQIAAHLANAGIRTHLLDIVPTDAPQGARNALAAAALKQLGKAKPAPLMDGDFERRITVGNIDDDLEAAVADSNLVIEAVVERLDVKRSLFARIAAAAKPGAILTTNTSGISIDEIAGGIVESARSRLAGMHFFNPPRYMHLLEVVPSKDTDATVVAELTWFCDVVLGKGVVLCRDTPNFIGNRIGVAEMLLTFQTAFGKGYTVEEVDLLNGPLMGRPRTGSFRLGDLIGIDVAGHVIRNLQTALSSDPGAPNHDELHPIMAVQPKVARMVERGLLGDKTGSGFYKKTRDEHGKRKILSLDLESLEYRERIEPAFAELAPVSKIGDLRQRVAAALRVDGRAGEFLRSVTLPLVNYAANRIGEICDTPQQIDDAMCWGYGWKLGPFALWDAAGVAWGVEQLERMDIEPAAAARMLLDDSGADAAWYRGTAAKRTVFVPTQGWQPTEVPPGVILLGAAKAAKPELLASDTASLIDIGDGVACLEFRSKMNIIDSGVIELLEQAVARLQDDGGFRGLVIGNQGDHFSAGADARQILALAREGGWDGIDASVRRFQDALMALRHAPLPVVVAPHKMALGGGCELGLHGAQMNAGAELYMGLVEAGIGLVPAGGGLKEMCRRASAWALQTPDPDPYPWLRRAFETIAQGKVSTSAFDAQNLGLMAPTDTVSFHGSRVVADAKRRAIALAEGGWAPPDPDEEILVIGAPRGASFMMGAQLFAWSGYASEHDKLVAQKIAHVLSGGMGLAPTRVTAQHILDLEREAFVSLCGEEKTQARIEHTLKTGKPLRN